MSVQRSRALLLCALIGGGCLLLAAGCTKEPKFDADQLVQVRGTVSYRGTPVAGAQLRFQPDAGDRPGATSEPGFAISDSSGRFNGMTNDTTGLWPGEYVVTVSHPDGLLPAKYADARTPAMRLTVELHKDYDLRIDLPD